VGSDAAQWVPAATGREFPRPGILPGYSTGRVGAGTPGKKGIPTHEHPPGTIDGDTRLGRPGGGLGKPRDGKE
jgi:hypothetical protein